MVYKAEYIWIDGAEPTNHLRSKTKISRRRRPTSRSGASTARSTNQATGDKSDCVLKPVASCPDPIRGGDNVLVHVRGDARRRQAAPDQHPRRAVRTAQEVQEARADVRHRAGVHAAQGTAPARLPAGGYPAPQGGYYCGVGDDEIHGRDIVEDHLDACLDAGLVDLGHQRRGHARTVGVPGRPARPARGRRPALGRPLAALPHRRGLRRLATLDAEAGQGRLERRRRHTNFSTIEMREDGGYKHIEAGCKALGKKADLHIANYGDGSRTASPAPRDPAPRPVQLRRLRPRRVDPHPVAGRQDKKGYLEDRRPNAQHRPVRRRPPA